MIDWVTLERLKVALETGIPPRFDVPIPDPDKPLYYRELVYMGFTPTWIARTIGFNAARMQAALRARDDRRIGSPLPTAPIYLEADEITVDHRPGAIILHIDGRLIVVEDSPGNLLALGRLVYSAATADQPEEIPA